jgi:putative hydrolases of HD superfamily
MYRMSIMTMLAPPSLASRLNVPRCTKMALIHDMAESLVGDITPVDGVSKAEKSRREEETMRYLSDDLLGKVYGGAPGESIREVWLEYEENRTLEAQFVHVRMHIVLPEVQQWCDEVLQEREGFWKSIGKLQPHPDMTEEEKATIDAYYVNGT